MPKQIIISMEENYPFGECEECNNLTTKVLVRKIYQYSNAAEKKKMYEKIDILRQLKNQNMVKIEAVLEEDDSIHFMFEYVPIKVETWISNINDRFIEDFRDHLIKFSSFLANNHIKLQFHLKNVGMDQNYLAKYFMDLNFEIDPSSNREKLKSSYIREITSMFQPYLMGPAAMVSEESEKNKIVKTSSLQVESPQLQASDQGKKKVASEDGLPMRTTKTKEKALERYYQQVNMSVDSENEKLLQEFMNVLDNDVQEQEESYEAPPEQRQTIHYYDLKITQNSDPSNQMSILFNKKEDSSPSPTLKQEPSRVQINNVTKLLSSETLPLQPKPSLTQKFLQPSKQQHKKPHSSSSSFAQSMIKHRQTMDYTQFARSTMQVQSRVNSIVERSRNVIKRFKQINNAFKN